MGESEIFRKKAHKTGLDQTLDAPARSKISSTFMEQQRPLKAFISRFIRRPQDIDDIAQETFVRAFLAEQKGDIQHPKAYIYRVARNLAFETLTKKSAQLTSYIEDSCDQSLLESEVNIEDKAIVTEKFDRVKVAIADMPPQCQRVFIMHKVYGFKYREISQQLGISVSTVEKHIMTGLKKCKESVKNQEKPNKVVSFSKLKTVARGHLEKR